MKGKFYVWLLILILVTFTLLTTLVSKAQGIASAASARNNFAESDPSSSKQGNNQALPQLLKQLEKQHSVKFLYRLDVVAGKPVPHLDVSAMSLTDALQVFL